MRPSNTTRPLLFPLALLALWALPSSLFANTLSELKVGNVTSSSVTVVWQVDGVGEPALDLFADPTFSSPPEGDPIVEFFPLHTGDADRPGGGEADYQRRAELTDAIAAEGLVLARVTGLTPGTEYHLLPDARDSNGDSALESAPPTASVTTAEFTDFVPEARQLILDLSADPAGPAANDGALARLALPGAPYPLFAVVGDGLGPGLAYFDLSHLLNPGGTTNAALSGEETVELDLLREGAAPQNETITFDGTFVVANAVTLQLDPDGAALAGFVFDAIATQQRNVAFPVTIRAIDADGNPLSSYNGTVIVGSDTAALSAGGGETAAFTDGVLSGHQVAVADTGTHRLTAESPDSAESGASNPFEVDELLRSLLLEAVPSEGGNVTGSGDFPNGTFAAITASPADGYTFRRWIGEGVTNRSNPNTTVRADADQLITAVFQRLVTASYDNWAQAKFLRDVGNPEISGKSADPDADGLSNLLEFAFGTDPRYGKIGEAVPTISRKVDNSLSLEFHRIRNSANVTYRVLAASEVSGPYSEITPDPATVSVTEINAEYEKVEIPVNVTGDRRFLRVKVELDENN